MPLTPQDLDAIDALFARTAARIVAQAFPVPRTAPAIIEPLTCREFACCIGRSEVYVRRLVRLRRIEAKGPPYLIQPAQLTRFGVDLVSAAARLRAAGLRSAPPLAA